MEIWVVQDQHGWTGFNADEELLARKVQSKLPTATLHHLVEAREKVWVVRNNRKEAFAIHRSNEENAWWAAWVQSQTRLEKFEFVEQCKAYGWTCREEWLGGGA